MKRYVILYRNGLSINRVGSSFEEIKELHVLSSMNPVYIHNLTDNICLSL